MVRRNVWFLGVTLVLVFGAFGATLLSGNTPILGLDLQGGISVVLAPVGKASADSLNVAKDIIDQRVNSLGVAEPEISRQGSTIIVDLPGVKNRDKAKRIVGQTAELRFRPVLNYAPVAPKSSAKPKSTTTTKPGQTTTTKAGATTTTKAGAATTSAATSAPGSGGKSRLLATPTTATPTTAPGDATTTAPGSPTTVPGAATTPSTTPRDKDKADQTVVLPDRDGKLLYELGPVPQDLTGRAVKTAQAELDQRTNEWVVNLTLTDKGAVAFNKLAGESFPKQPPQNAVAIVLDSVVVSAPAFRAATFEGGNVQISGNFDSTAARDLARILKYGALPVALKQLTSENVSPTLGTDQLHAGIAAGIIGLALVAIYMLAYYRLLGLVVIFGLVVSAAALYTLIVYLGRSIGLAMTLAGVTGIIVSVGITVDSYVVYFERLKDEVRTGKTVRSSLDRAFTRSFRTIVAADLVSLIGATVLYLLAIGSVRGFALFLGIATVLDLVISYTFMHPLVSLIGRRRGLVEGWFGVARGLDAQEASV